MPHRRRTHTALVAACVASLVGCGDESRTVSEVRTVTAEPVAAASSAARFGLDSQPAPSHPGEEGPAPYVWQVPPEWQALPPTPMRAASFAVKSAPQIDCSLTILPAGGGGLGANLNRWRKQMSLPDLTAKDLEALPTLAMLGTTAVRLECDGTYRGMGNETPRADTKLLGLAVEHEGRALFVKMVGPAAAVARESERFDAFCRSLQATTHEMHATAPVESQAPPPAATTAAAAPRSWDAPPTWRRVQAGSMRLVSFAVGPDDATEVYVTVLSGAAGGLEANVNRWRQQMSQPELTPPEIAALPAIPMLGQQGRLVRIRGNFTGMDGATRGDAMMLGAVCERADQSVFVKMIGPADVVGAEEQNFAAFCRSLQ